LYNAIPRKGDDKLVTYKVPKTSKVSVPWNLVARYSQYRLFWCRRVGWDVHAA